MSGSVIFNVSPVFRCYRITALLLFCGIRSWPQLFKSPKKHQYCTFSKLIWFQKIYVRRPLKIRNEELCIQSVTVFALKNHSISNIRVQIGGQLFYPSIPLMTIGNCMPVVDWKPGQQQAAVDAHILRLLAQVFLTPMSNQSSHNIARD